MSLAAYIETFDDGPGGWIADLRTPLPVWDGVAYCGSPWSVDANHVSPGAGYLHLLMYLLTHQTQSEKLDAEQHGANRFVEEGFSRNLTNARITVRLRGRLSSTGPLCNNHVPATEEQIGAQLLLLVQSRVEGPPATTANFLLTDQPLKVTPEWSEQTLRLDPDPDHWMCLGSRHDMADVYGYADIGEVLADVNVDIIFVLFPLRIVPIGDVADIHRAWAAIDYKVDSAYLPKGLVMFDTVQIEYP